MQSTSGVALALLLAAPLIVDAAPSVAEIDALEIAADLATKVGGYSARHPDAPGAFAPWSRGDAEAGIPLLIHAYPTLEPSYYYVQLSSPDGGDSFITLDADDGQWQAYGRRPEGFPAVTRDGAALAASRKLQIEIAPEALRAVSMPDKRLYWYFRSPNDGDELFIRASDANDIITNASAITAHASIVDVEPLEPVAPHKGGGFGDRLDPRYPIAFDIPDVPHHYQITRYHCGPAAVQMVMDYWGPEIDQEDVGKAANTQPSGTHITDMMRAGHFSAISAAIQDPDLQGYAGRRLGYGAPACYWSYPDSSDPDFPSRHHDLKSIISAACPVIVVMRYDTATFGTHARVVKGYDHSAGVYIVHDPWYDGVYQGPDVHFNQNFFDELWARSYRWGGFIAPWEVSIDAPAEVIGGMPFTVTANVVYRGPLSFGAQDVAYSPSVTLLPSNLHELAPGESASQTLSGWFSDSGCAYDAVTWNLVADTLVQTGALELLARGIVHESSSSYWSYSDSIGGRGEAELSVTSPALVTVDNTGGGTFVNIQDALDFVRCGRTVEVLPGVYTGENNRDLSFHGKNIRLRGVEGPRVTVIDCEGAGRGFSLTDGEGRTALIEGFTIRNGRAPTSDRMAAGGGLYLRGTSPTIRNVILESNSSPGWAGGLWCSGDARPKLEYCIFLKNEAALCGGAIASMEGAAPELLNCTLALNAAPECGGIFCQESSPLLTDTIIYGSTDGGALACEQGAAPVLTSCCIYGNSGGDDLPSSCIASGTLFVDPQLCGAERDALHLEECSPCAGSGATGGDIGALPTRCACDQNEMIPGAFFFHPARPSPFRSATRLRLDIPPTAKRVTLAVYNVGGQLVRTLVDGEVRPGEREYIWRGDDDTGDAVGAGIYFARCEYGNARTSTRKIVLVR